MMTEITMISTLPPVIGLSSYTNGLVGELSKIVKINFLGFNHIYPSFLYAGKLFDYSAPRLEEHVNLKIKNVLNWYNPIGWIIEAFRIKTKVIHAQWWSYPLAPIYLVILGINKLRGKKIIITAHNIKPHERDFFKNFLHKSVFLLGHEFIVHTKQNKDELLKIINNRPIHIIPHGLITYPQAGISSTLARVQLGISEKDFVLLCFGHIRPYKGLDVAIRALSRIEDKNIKLLIAGKSWEDWTKYEQLIDRYQLKDRIILKIGYIDTNETESIFKASNLVLLPYKHFDAQSGIGLFDR